MVKIDYLYTDGGNVATSQGVIRVGNDKYFQSYDTIIAAKENGVVTLDEKDWNCSKTTLKYLYQFLRNFCYIEVYSKRDLMKLIEEGEINLQNLNED